MTIPRAATKTWCSQINKNFKKKNVFLKKDKWPKKISAKKQQENRSTSRSSQDMISFDISGRRDKGCALSAPVKISKSEISFHEDKGEV